MRAGQEFSPEERDSILAEARIQQAKKIKELPSSIKRGKNLVKAVTKHIANSMINVDQEEYTRRLNICNDCDTWRLGKNCTHDDCGCVLTKKAWWESEHCPIGLW